MGARLPFPLHCALSPSLFAVHLLELDALGLNLMLLCEVVHAGGGHPQLPVDHAQSGGNAHVEAPVVHVMTPQEVGVDGLGCKRRVDEVLDGGEGEL